MKVYGDLTLSGQPDALTTAVNSIEEMLSSGWERSRELESRMPAGDARCFVAPSTDSHPAAALWLAPRPERSDWYVANIVPLEAGGLTEDQYNSILREFNDRFLKPVATRSSIIVTLGKFEKSAHDFMSEAAVQRLDAFSTLANKSTGSGHPADQERWFRFIVQVERDGYGPDASTLADLLREHFEWPAEKASELALEYEFGRALLRHTARE